jgi:phosphoglycerate kinase
MFTKKTVRDIDVQGKIVIVRTMLNVPIEDGMVGDLRRLESSVPTLRYLLERGAGLVLISHHSHEGQSLAVVAPQLAKLLDCEIQFMSDSLGQTTAAVAKALQPGQVIMLENLRFHPEEEANDETFAKTLASYGQIYVNDDFTTCHREHASMVGIPKFLPAVAGLSVETEVSTITAALDDPKRPLVAVSGGAKISTKVPIISFLLGKVDVLMIGGAMANTFLAAMGLEMGKSLMEDDQFETARQIIKNAKDSDKQLILPKDLMVVTDIDDHENIRIVAADQVGADDIVVDIGPETVKDLQAAISGNGTVIWNGPMGIAEDERYSAGTKGVADAIIASGAYCLVGGGDTADFIDGAGLKGKFGFESNGGGASLELMSGNSLPAVDALQDK